MTRPRGARFARRQKPQLIRIGDHYVSPENVLGFKQAKKGLYILQLRNQPEMEFPLWVSEREMLEALEHFEVLGAEQ